VGSGLAGVQSLGASPDGKSLYAGGSGDDAVASFKRKKKTGKLTYQGCITGETESGPTGSGACEEIDAAASGGANSGLDFPTSLAASADGKSLYAGSTSDDAIASFQRDEQTGTITYTSCITGETASGPTGSDACAAIADAASNGANSGLDSLRSLAASADGKSLYAASAFDAAVTSFTRDTETGDLTYTGCITGETESGPTGSGACEEIDTAASGGANSGLDFPTSLAASPDGKSLYAASINDQAVASFGRSP
jgi:6-phosphogluconolactonase (cycloisomerase 2 family)